MKIGYIRVSTEEQNLARQEELMTALGVQLDDVYRDKLSGKDAKRPGLDSMLNYVRRGDTVCVESISRIARNTKDLLELIDKLAAKGVAFYSHKETIDTSTVQGKFMLTVFGAMAELERGYILERQREGIEIAKKQGKYRGREPVGYDGNLLVALYPAWKAGEITAKEFMKRLDVKPNTFYRRIKDYEQSINTAR